jgi:hypothetical protein
MLSIFLPTAVLRNVFSLAIVAQAVGHFKRRTGRVNGPPLSKQGVNRKLFVSGGGPIWYTLQVDRPVR